MASQGPNFASTATGNTSTVGGGNTAWTSPSNANAADGVFTACTLSGVGNGTTDDLNLQGFGFSIPSTATINGILVEINRMNNNAFSASDGFVQLLKGGVVAGSNKANLALWPTSATTQSYGSSSDLWGTTWAPSDINASNFGFVFTGNGAAGADILSIDFVRITVTFTSATSSSQMFKMF